MKKNRWFDFDFEFKPKLLSTLPNYNKQTFFADLMAGCIVGIVAMPLAIAFAMASGVSPEKGIITAIVAGFLISLFGGSRVQIGGPTGVFIVIFYEVVQTYGELGLVVATFLAGIMLFLMGAFKLGTVIKFIPYPIVVGFTSGIAITIFSTQIKEFFGLDITDIPSDFTSKWGVYFSNLDKIDLYTTLTGLITILIIIITPRFIKRIPGYLIAIVVVSIAVYVLKAHLDIHNIQTIGDRFTIGGHLPTPKSPAFNLELIKNMMPTAITIAVFGAIESILSATVADGVIGDKHDSNQELMGQGIANMVVPFFGGIPATGAAARTMTNVSNGAKTPIAGIIHSIVLLLILICLSWLTKHIPMACLAGILVVVSYNLSEWRTFRSLLRMPTSDVVVLLVTFFLTVIFNLTIAIELGLVIACLLFMHRMTDNTHISVNIGGEIDPSLETDFQFTDEKITIPPGVEVYEIDGPYFFGIANKFEEQMLILADKPKVRIIRMRKVPFIDSSGVHSLEALCRKSKAEKIHIVLSGVNPPVREVLERAGFEKLIGERNICPHINIALTNAKEYIERNDGKH